MPGKILSSAQKSPGQSLVEMAIFMIILLFLLAGAINLGVAFFDYVAIRDAAQEGALYGSIYPAADPLGNKNTTAIIARVQQSSTNPVDLMMVTPQVVYDGDPAHQTCAGHLLVVSVAYDSPVIMPILGVFTDKIPLKASAVSRILVSPTNNCP
jgi:Flp pilus assembly protein TadG